MGDVLKTKQKLKKPNAKFAVCVLLDDTIIGPLPCEHSKTFMLSETQWYVHYYTLNICGQCW